jgi:DNA (cytosine-5)-methyltransferase 1
MNELRTCHLFAGIGGGLLADIILGHKPVVAVEWDSYACKVLRERAAEGWFPGLSVWEGDVRLFDPSEYAGVVDCIHAGFPCQDISVAGKQAGVSEGTRSGLYREVLRIAGVVRPRYLFLENVSAILSNGLGTVLADLAAMGYDSRWLCIRASDVGAPHHRDRWFLLADACRTGSSVNKHDRASYDWKPSGATCEHSKAERGICDSNSARLEGSHDHKKPPKGVYEIVSERCGFLPYSKRKRLQGHGESKSSEHSAQKSNRETTQSFHGSSPNFWTTEPGLGRVANGVPNRVGQLKGYGNAQVPLQAAAAWRLLGGPT